MSDEVLASMILEERLLRLERVLDQRLGGLTVLLEDVYKEQNMTACIRTLEALGIQNVHVIEGDSDFVPNPRITQGCDKWVDLHKHADAAAAAKALKRSGHRIYATSLEASHRLETIDFSEPCAIVFGNELSGVTDELLALADGTFKIPMFGFSQSFNLSVSVAICAHHAASARRAALGRDSDLSPQDRARLRSSWLRLARKGSDEILEALSRQRANS